MAETANSETQLLAEHFGYPPVSLLDDVINSINILAEQALNSVEKGLLSVPPASLGFRAPPPPPPKSKSSSATAEQQPPAAPSPEEAHRHEVENGTHQLETLLCASIDRNFDLFELWVMRNILTVRPDDRDWIRLSHYEGLDFSAVTAAAKKKRRKGEGEGEGVDGGNTPGDGSEDADAGADNAEGAGGRGLDVPTVESVSRLRRRLQASQKLNVMLHAERARNAALLAELRGVILGDSNSSNSTTADAQPKTEDGNPAPPPPPQPTSSTASSLAFLRNRGDLTESDASTPLTTTTAFTLSQLQALRALSTSLRTMLPDLQDTTAGTSGSTEEQGGGSSSSSNPRQRQPTTTSWRTERLEYVEGAARKHLENVRGLELGRNGEVRDGEWQGPGRSLNPGEVEGLERVAAAIGGGGQGGGGGGEGEGRGEEEGVGGDEDDDGDERMSG